MLRKALHLIPVNVTLIPKLNFKQVKGPMSDPTLYHKHNKATKVFATDALKEFSSKIKWKKNKAKILDVGSGDGGVTSEVLKSFIPRNFEKLVGIDISPEMVKHANLHYKEDRVEFKVVDILAVPADLVEQFDHIFSFFTLNYVQDQKKTMSNIYSMLVPGGDCAFIVICNHPFFDTNRVLATKPDWSQYMYETEQYVSPYQDSQTPEDDFTQLMNECGFLDVDVRVKECSFDFGDLDSLKGLATAVNPFVHRMSPSVRECFINDYMIELRKKMDSVSDEKNNQNMGQPKIGKFEMFMTLFFAYGAK